MPVQPDFSDKGVALLKAFEGVILKGYLDIVKVPTIGGGHTAATGELIHYADGTVTTKVIIGKAITMAEADRLLKADVAHFARQIDKLIKVQLTANQHDAVLSLAYNIGAGGFARSSVLRNINAGNFKAAAASFAAWNKAGGKVVNGLVRRRAAEAKLFLDATHYQVAMNDNYGDMPQAVDDIADTMAA